jgi:hypothetical protein
MAGEFLVAVQSIRQGRLMRQVRERERTDMRLRDEALSFLMLGAA